MSCIKMDHRAFLGDLPPQTKAELYQHQAGRGLRHLMGHLGLIVIFGFLGLSSWPGAWVALFALGVALVFLFTLEHETAHKTPFVTPWINDAVGCACGLVILLPFTWFRYFHLAHHRYTNDPERDPELLAGGAPKTWPAFVWHVSGVPYWSSMARTTLALALGKPPEAFVPLRAHGTVRREAQIMCLLYIAAALSLVWSPLVFVLWWGPVLAAQPVLRLYLLAEHSHCPPVADMFVNTRTVFTNPLVRFLAWNMPYHIEHHAAPQVPFYKLPKLHELAKSHLVTTAPSYHAFHRDFATRLSSKEL
ncbi:MAG: fatty acid desaturase [Pseudomonadota bacterium]